MTTASVKLRAMTPDDWPEVARIYDEGLKTGNATFQQVVPTWEEWNTGHVQSCRMVAIIEGTMAGWAALSAVSSRAVYAGVAEVSVYIGKDFRGMRIGNRLMKNLIDESEKESFWTLQSSIFPENEASIKLHEKYGLRTIGYREKVGKMDGVWRDTVIMERRSKVVGID
ncbi:phosphinothricin N-acetyltransferase [Prolixibacter bellariivorans]|uniref:Phosphinothricin N-acetyltransferase n=1 Tax=Prolixibacter bellariivorans TaxID=314319 RepID=A0A5M4AY43_9BACT|nr:GNAT family N-acetyltransferase [Prolixibacter bellariivorans]GET32835.1 phosphinothricin N-acetyltransferase [Prolixibacter bellariivorans]